MCFKGCGIGFLPYRLKGILFVLRGGVFEGFRELMIDRHLHTMIRQGVRGGDPFGMQIFQRTRLRLGRTCRQCRLLREFNELFFGWFVAVIGHKFCFHFVEFGANIAAPGGKSTNCFVANADDFMDGFAVLHPGLEL